jgi:hypothetical protein
MIDQTRPNKPVAITILFYKRRSLLFACDRAAYFGWGRAGFDDDVLDETDQ